MISIPTLQHLNILPVKLITNLTILRPFTTLPGDLKENCRLPSCTASNYQPLLNNGSKLLNKKEREREKHVYRQALMNPQAQKYMWIDCPSHNRLKCHPNNETVPMQVDPPKFTQVYCTYTDMDKNHLKEG